MITIAPPKLKDLKAVESELNRKISKIKNVTKKGIVAAAVHIKGESMRITPRDLGNLVNSAYVVWQGGSNQKKEGAFVGGVSGGRKVNVDKLNTGHTEAVAKARNTVERESQKHGGGPFAEIGYSAYYAVYVHEIKFTNYTKPGTQWKYLETALKNSLKEALNIIKKHSQ